MLLSFTVENFRSFAEPATLAMTHLKTVTPRAGTSWEDATERVAAIYGANASGKTNLLDAICALSLALRSPGVPSLWQPNAASSKQPVTYSIDFLADGIRHSYELEVLDWGIGREVLYSYPKGSRRLVFARTQQEGEDAGKLEKGASLTGPTASVWRITKPRALFLATARKYGHDVLAPVANALAASVGMDFIAFRDRQDEYVLRRALYEMLEDPSQADLISALLRAADVGIQGIAIEAEEVPSEVMQTVRRLIEAFREDDEPLPELPPSTRDVVTFIHEGEDGKTFSLPIRRESAGTITWLTTAWHALNVLRHGTLLLVDELDASLHPGLARYLVQLFLDPQMNPHGAQLIFTTHDVSLLGNSPTRLLEPRQVWFTEKDRSGRSELFCLDDFDNRAQNNNELRYLAGKFGAIPVIDEVPLLNFIESNLVAANA